MEGRAHSKQAYAQEGQVSFMDGDLARCRDDMVASFKPRPAVRTRAILSSHQPSENVSSRSGNDGGLERDNGTATPGRQPTVAVVGAGLAGLRCAEVLLQRGFKVTLFEARDHVGGRVCQEQFSGVDIDIGASWVHGTKDNPIADLAAASGTVMCAIPEHTLVFSPSGTVVSDDKVNTGLDRVWELISDAFRESNRRGDLIDPKTSLKDYFLDRLSDGDESERSLILMLAEQWGGFIGDEWHKQSLRWFWLEECLDGENLFVPNSHAGVIRGIYDPVVDSPNSTIKLSSRVSAIKTDTFSGDPQVTITISTDPAPLRFDEVVVAVPLGCLKKSHISFDPPLLPAITKAVEQASISSFEKIYLAFSAPWWDGPDEVSEQGPCFVHYLTPKYLPDGQPAYSMEIVTLSSKKVFGKHSQPMVFVQTYGECAAHIIAMLRPHDRHSPEYLAILSRFFKPYLALLPHYDTKNPTCLPIAAVSTAWLDDELGGFGSYTNFKTSNSKPGEIVLDDNVRSMREGEPDRGLWFAGEHVAPFVALGTTTGAYWSGECVAMRIAAAHGMAGDGKA